MGVVSSSQKVPLPGRAALHKRITVNTLTKWHRHFSGTGGVALTDWMTRKVSESIAQGLSAKRPSLPIRKGLPFQHVGVDNTAALINFCEDVKCHDMLLPYL